MQLIQKTLPDDYIDSDSDDSETMPKKYSENS
jgi:hypothetical protein